MVKKIFLVFFVLSLLTLAGLGGYYYYDSQKNIKTEPVVVIPNVPSGTEEEVKKEETETKEPTFKTDVYSVHLCDRYSDGTYSIRNIKLGMTFRQVVDIELKNIGVYVESNEYGKDTFYAMASDENQGKDLLPVKERALLQNACSIIYNFSSDITVEDPAEYPYLESVQIQFPESSKPADANKEIEKAFSDCFGKPVIETEGMYSMSVFEGESERIRMFYEYSEENEVYNLRYIIWDKNED